MPKQKDGDRDEERGFGPEDGRGRFSGRYTREQDDRTGGRQFPPKTDSRPPEDTAKDEGGERGGYSGSFERESDDYDRSMDTKHRARDDDYVELGEDARFSDRGQGRRG